MKKIFILLLSFLAIGHYTGFSQTVKASLGVGSTASNVIIYLTPSATQTPATIGTLQFNIGIDASTITTAPALSVVSSGFSGVTWAVTPAYLEGGYWNYNITTPSSPLQPNFTAGTEFQAMELNFSGGVPSTANVSLVTLPDGGTSTTFALFLCTGTIQSDGSSLYYVRPGATIVNNFSYDITGSSAGSATSTATIGPIVVPIKFTGFSAAKKDDNALLNWSVSNEGPSTDHYEVERSFDGANFTKVTAVATKGSGNLTSNTYSYTDQNISLLKSSGVIYYRIEQVDKSGQVIFTEIKTVKLVSKGLLVGAYPNPAKSTVSVSLFLDQDASLLLNLSDASGKMVRQLQLHGTKGSNISKLNLDGLASGSYLLKVNSGTEIATLPIVKE